MTRSRTENAMKVAMMLLLGACTEDDAPPSGGNGGAGGSPGLAGSGGTDATAAGSAGAAGNAGEPSDAGSPRIVGTLQESRVDITSHDPIWVEDCVQSTQLLLRSGPDWLPARDERPQAPALAEAADSYLSHYLNGGLQERSCNFTGCHVQACVPVGAPGDTAPAYLLSHPAFEYVQMGVRPYRGCAPDGGTLPVDAGDDAGGDAGRSDGVQVLPDLRRVVPSAPLAVRVRYFRNASCSGEPELAIVPAE